MRRTFAAILLFLIITTTPLFSVVDSFAVTTDVAQIGLMKVSSTKIEESTLAGYNDLESYDTLVVENSGNQSFKAYMTTLCNNRTGYKVTMSATPMTSTEGSVTSHINYTVSCNGHDVPTTLASENAPTLIVNVGSLTQLTGRSKRIKISVDAETFDAAVAGTYTGTVTFTFAAN